MSRRRVAWWRTISRVARCYPRRDLRRTACRVGREWRVDSGMIGPANTAGRPTTAGSRVRWFHAGGRSHVFLGDW